MSEQYFDRYESFGIDGSFKIIPGIEIPIKTTDKYFQFKKGKDRLDKVSQDNYDSPLFGWLILLANPSLGGIEFDIPDDSIMRIPFPIVPTLQDYKKAIEIYQLYYGE